MSASQGELSAPPSVDFGTVYVGYPASASLELRNRGSSPISVRATVAAPFTTAAAEVAVGGGASQTLRLTLSAVAAGPQSGELVLSGDDGAQVKVALGGTALAPPVCATPDPCASSVFSPDAGACLESPVADGTACSAGCLLSGSCLSGTCRAAMVASCDDGNPCTLDACGASGSCQHYDKSAECPDPGDPCRVAFCDPDAGCGGAPVEDGTFCGKSDCVTADICLSGVCTTVAAQEGSVCSPATACQGPGICHSKNCNKPPPNQVVLAWSYDAGVPVATFIGPLADEAGNVYFDEQLYDAGTVSFRLVSLNRDGAVKWRWAIPASEYDPGFDYPARPPVIDQETVVYCAPAQPCIALRTSNGSEKWTFDPAVFFTDGADPKFVTSVASAGPQGVVVAARSMNPDAGGGGAALLDWGTGTPSWIRQDPLMGRVTITDEAANAYFTGWHADGGYNSERSLTSVTSSGAVRWTAKAPTARSFNFAAASYGGRVSVADVGAATGFLLSAVDGSPLNSLGTWHEIMVMDGAHGWSLAPLVQSPYGYAIYEWDLATGQFNFVYPIDAYSWDRPLVLLERGALLSTTRAGSFYGLDSKGKLLFSCDVEGSNGVGDPPALAPLGRGRWVSRTPIGLDAFDLGVDPAARGWIMTGRSNVFGCPELGDACPTDGTLGGAHRPR
ncbi:MAG: hypothetical protein QM723_11275 [Myxococcaceae bacterium]